MKFNPQENELIFNMRNIFTVGWFFNKNFANLTTVPLPRARSLRKFSSYGSVVDPSKEDNKTKDNCTRVHALLTVLDSETQIAVKYFPQQRTSRVHQSGGLHWPSIYRFIDSFTQKGRVLFKLFLCRTVLLSHGRNTSGCCFANIYRYERNFDAIKR